MLSWRHLSILFIYLLKIGDETLENNITDILGIQQRYLLFILSISISIDLPLSLSSLSLSLYLSLPSPPSLSIQFLQNKGSERTNRRINGRTTDKVVCRGCFSPESSSEIIELTIKYASDRTINFSCVYVFVCVINFLCGKGLRQNLMNISFFKGTNWWKIKIWWINMYP